MSASNTAAAARIVSIGPTKLEGMLAAPENPIGLVIFAHGSGSSRLSPRNNAVALAFRERGLATLLFDLLTQREAILRRNVFDIGLLATRVVEAIVWARQDDQLRPLPIGLFGASTGAAAALSAAAERPSDVSAVVSRGGRPDLAAANLPLVRAPTLLIVGGADDTVLALNEQAYQRMVCEKKLHVVPGATHLFEEEGALEEVVAQAAAWFCAHLSGHGSTR